MHLFALPYSLHGHNLVLEAAAGAGVPRALVAARSHLVLLLARDAVALRHVLRCHACAHIQSSLHSAQEALSEPEPIMVNHL